jgi:hypothetical protein
MSGLLEWMPGDAYYQITKCRRFTVAKTHGGVTADVVKYIAYDCTEETLSKPAERLGTRDRLRDARLLCERRARTYDPITESQDSLEESPA